MVITSQSRIPISSRFKQSASEHRSPKLAVKLRTIAIRGPHSAATILIHSSYIGLDKATACPGVFPRAFFLLRGILPTMAFCLLLPAIGHKQWWFSTKIILALPMFMFRMRKCWIIGKYALFKFSVVICWATLSQACGGMKRKTPSLNYSLIRPYFLGVGMTGGLNITSTNLQTPRVPPTPRHSAPHSAPAQRQWMLAPRDVLRVPSLTNLATSEVSRSGVEEDEQLYPMRSYRIHVWYIFLHLVPFTDIKAGLNM